MSFNSSPSLKASSVEISLSTILNKSKDLLLSQQFDEGYWWYTLEANESINAEYIFLNYLMNLGDQETCQKIAARILSVQQADGSWPLYYAGPGDLSTTIECYLALKMMGYDTQSAPMLLAKQFILSHGGLSRCRVFTRIHLAQLGILPWDLCPSMPLILIALPSWFPINIYEFSSWARACIVPLLVVLNKKPTASLGFSYLEELLPTPGIKNQDWSYKIEKKISWENFFIQLDKVLHVLEKVPTGFLEKALLKKCEDWIVEHIEKTEDIYPALAYGAMALEALGHSKESPSVKKCLNALKSFQISLNSPKFLPEIPLQKETQTQIYQQCCISPVWDTPWVGQALCEAGLPLNHPSLIKAAKWLLSKQILTTYGDWAIKNKRALPGGWSFEFENDYFPDVDDTLQVIRFLKPLAPYVPEIDESIHRALDWLLSMQSRNGGWAAFDRDNLLILVNRIPFSDHGACLDPPSPDLTGRVLDLLGFLGFKPDFPPIQKALNYLYQIQASDGSWWGRWAVNTLFGTSCVLQGLASLGIASNPSIERAWAFLIQVQNSDGGYGESCDSYKQNEYVPLGVSVASQTAWALLGLMAYLPVTHPTCVKTSEYLIKNQNNQGAWDEPYYTGTGFPGHFYIRYHGYRHFFPLLALGRYEKLSRQTT